MQPTLPHNFIFELAKRSTSQLIGLSGTLYVLGEGSPRENFYHDPRGSYPLKEVATISKLENLYKIKFSKQIEEWRRNEIEKIKKIPLDYSKEEHELLKFIVKDVLPRLGICETYEEKPEEETGRKCEFGTIWDSMINKVAPLGKYPEEISKTEKHQRGPKGKGKVIENFSIWGNEVYPLLEEEKVPPFIDETRFIQFNGKKYFYINPVSTREVDELYQNSLEMEIRRDILSRMKNDNVSEFRTLKNIIDKFNSIHRDRGVYRNSPQNFTLFITTYPRYSLYCTAHRRYYLFDTATIASTLTTEGFSKPRIIHEYKHPYVFQDGNICFGDFEPSPNPNDPGLELASWLLNGRDCLMISYVDGRDEANPHHESFKTISIEEIKERKIPITNFRRKWLSG